MGERVQKIAFLVFALAFVAIMAVLNTSILTLGTSANGQLTSTISSNDSALAIYDQGSVYGSSVSSCAKDPGKVCATEMNVFVITCADTAGAKYDVNNKYTAAVNEDQRINSAAKFESHLCYNTNQVCTGILFIQEGAAKTGAQALIGELTAPSLT